MGEETDGGEGADRGGDRWGAGTDGREMGMRREQYGREEGEKVAQREREERIVSQQREAEQEGKPEPRPETFTAGEVAPVTSVSTRGGISVAAGCMSSGRNPCRREKGLSPWRFLLCLFC